MIRATNLAWIPLGLALVSINSSLAVLADSSPSPSPASPPPTVSLSSSSGKVGTSITVTGSGFPPLTSLAVYVDSPDLGYVATPARLNGGVGPQTDSKGSFSQDIVIPSAQFGPHGICADTGYPGSSVSSPVKACAQFSVQPQVTISVSGGLPGTSFTLTGTGFPAGEIVALYIDTPKDGSAADGNITGPFFGTPGPYADFHGGVIQELVWPSDRFNYKGDPVAAGQHVICGDTGYPGNSQTIKVKACAQFVVQARAVPSLLLSPSSGGVGTNVLVKGTGFPTSVQFYITLDSKTVVSDTCSKNLTDATGSFQLQLAMQLHTSYRSCPPITISYGTHQMCVDAMEQACADFELFGGPAAATADGGIFGPKGPLRLFAVAAGLAALILLAVGAIFLVRRVGKPRSLPPLD